jgi:hypothetical protein
MEVEERHVTNRFTDDVMPEVEILYCRNKYSRNAGVYLDQQNEARENGTQAIASRRTEFGEALSRLLPESSMPALVSLCGNFHAPRALRSHHFDIP